MVCNTSRSLGELVYLRSWLPLADTQLSFFDDVLMPFRRRMKRLLSKFRRIVSYT